MSALVIDGHPNPDSLTSALARRYADAHGDARLLAVRDLDFDPILHQGYVGDQTLEPDLRRALDDLLSADHVAIATPIWWASTPALLKGLLDRILIPKVTYRYRPNGFPEGLLRGRTGRILMTCDSPRWFLALSGDPAVKALKRQTMQFCGIRPVRLTRFTNVRHADEARRASWLDRAAVDGSADACRGVQEVSRTGPLVRA
ncbi:NAD(P)H-dependent oxidoreductase [Microbacterium karelineae]|uniref:NAD(P)H-dependent oxidoreductase n=1 Tax=Microbacterium karelineae TaxID=2654283 RepID=UPI0012E9B9C8|nr:NAD(P)H-dependent oxidoreductase [Microbacterium karelineae]